MADPLTALALNGTLKTSDKAPSSTERMLDCLLAELAKEGVEGEQVRLADYDIKPGVLSDEGPGDQWPALRERVLAADILICGTPIWLGQPSSVLKRALERIDAFLSEMDDDLRMPPFDRVALVAAVGNEDGAHHVGAEVFQALNDIGFTIPASGMVYWVGEAMGGTDFKDLDEVPEAVQLALTMAARTSAHLARLLKADGYPAMT